MSGDLAAFLAARLDEDEAAARKFAKAVTCGQPRGETWVYDPKQGYEGWDGSVREAATRTVIANCSAPEGPFIARHDPARMLADVVAKRAILAEHFPVIPSYGPDKDKPCCGRCGAVDDPFYTISWPCETVRHVAAVYSGHPGYRQEWKP